MRGRAWLPIKDKIAAIVATYQQVDLEAKGSASGASQAHLRQTHFTLLYSFISWLIDAEGNESPRWIIIFPFRREEK
jgi:hypothetical protein